MGNVYFISDLHLGHKNMALRRGFLSVEEHDAHIVEQWNSVVKKRDVVWILGDVTMERNAPYHLLKEMRGMKNVVMGNHDKGVTSTGKSNIHQFYGMVKWRGFWLTHCPMHPVELRNKKNIHGHVHDNTLNDSRYINVSCENINYTPVLFAEIMSWDKSVFSKKNKEY